MVSRSDVKSDRLDAAARAGWLYYVAGNKQDEIAQKLNVSRQTAQRLVSLALDEKLVKIRIDHPIADCIELSHRLTEEYGLQYCDVAPSDPDAPDLLTGIAIAGAAELQRVLELDKPQVIALGTGRALRACIEQLPRMDCPHHHIVSVVGNTTLDGSATPYNTVVRMAARTAAPYNPLSVTVFARTKKDRSTLHALEPVKKTLQLCANADVTFVGIGSVGADSPVVVDGLLARDEVRALERLGAVGEVIGWTYDRHGQLIDGFSNDRNTSAPLVLDSDKPVIGIAMGQRKLAAMSGALRGKLINGLITDENTARALLDGDA